MIILCDISDYKETVDEARLQWIIETLMKLGMQEECLLNPRSTKTTEWMEANLIELYDRVDSNEVDILKSGNLIAQWKESKRVKVIDNDGKVYYRIHCNFWSKF